MFFKSDGEENLQIESLVSQHLDLKKMENCPNISAIVLKWPTERFQSDCGENVYIQFSFDYFLFHDELSCSILLSFLFDRLFLFATVVPRCSSPGAPLPPKTGGSCNCATAGVT